MLDGSLPWEMRTNSQGFSSLDALVSRSSQCSRYTDCWCSSGLRCSFFKGFYRSHSKTSLKFLQLSRHFSALVKFQFSRTQASDTSGKSSSPSCPHYVWRFVSRVSSNAREPGLEPVPEHRRDGGSLQVVTVQSSTVTDSRSEGGDWSVFNGQYFVFVSLNVLCLIQAIQQKLLFILRCLHFIWRVSFNRRDVYSGYTSCF